MEELLILLLQLAIELGFQLLGSCDLIDLLPFRSKFQDPIDADGCIGISFAFLLLGALCGLIVNVVHNKVLIPFAWLRIANLIAGPLLSGGISYLLAVRRSAHAPDIKPWTRFWFGFSYTLAFVVIRFAYGTR